MAAACGLALRAGRRSRAVSDAKVKILMALSKAPHYFRSAQGDRNELLEDIARTRGVNPHFSVKSARRQLSPARMELHRVDGARGLGLKEALPRIDLVDSQVPVNGAHGEALPIVRNGKTGDDAGDPVVGHEQVVV